MAERPAAEEEVAFIEDVAAYLAGRSPDECIKLLQTQHTKLQQTESRLLQQRARLQTREPEIKKALDMVKLLQAKQARAQPPQRLGRRALTSSPRLLFSTGHGGGAARGL
jgi:hypothetical protein